MLKRLGTLFCVSALAVACSQTDAGITTSVKSKLAADEMVKAYQIDVDTHDHVVTLSGRVETSAAKDQAIAIARNTEGVRDVVDQLTVSATAPTTGALEELRDDAAEAAREGADRTRETADRAGAAMKDAAITSAVKAKLLADDMVRGLSIDVDTDHGRVTLHGNVRTRAEANQAVTLARQTDGVKNVVDNMTVAR